MRGIGTRRAETIESQEKKDLSNLSDYKEHLFSVTDKSRLESGRNNMGGTIHLN